MQLIDSVGAVTTLPTPLNTSITPGYFAQVSATGGALTPTVVSSDFLNMMMLEICNVVTSSGATLSKTNYTQLRDAINNMISVNARVKMTTNLLLFVATTGSDTLNTGLASNSPFKTIQKAIDTLYHGYDMNGYQAIIQIADGTYNTPVAVYGQPVGHTNQPIVFQGNIANPGNVLIYVPSGNAWINGLNCWTVLTGMTFSAGGTSTAYSGVGSGLLCATGTYTEIHNVGFASCSNAQISALNGAVITADFTPVSFTGTSSLAINSSTGSLVWLVNSVLTCNSPTYTQQFATANNSGSIAINGATFVGSGSVTGQKYNIYQNGTLNLFGVTLPGTVAGTTSYGGQVIL